MLGERNRFEGWNDSEFGMKAETRHPHRTAVPIVGGVCNVLKIGSGKKTAPDSYSIVSLDDILWAGMRKLSISDEDAQATGIKKSLMVARDAVDHTANTHYIARSAPSRAR